MANGQHTGTLVKWHPALIGGDTSQAIVAGGGRGVSRDWYVMLKLCESHIYIYIYIYIY